jgi:uncharacterized phage-associated protein
MTKQKSINVAKYFIYQANEVGSFISNLKLQKLVFYSQAWHLALFGEPLFEEDFEAWIHGPVEPNLYREYKRFGSKPIELDVSRDILKEFSEEKIEFLNEVRDNYLGYDAFELEMMTHREDPWIDARKGLSIDQESNNIISKEAMKKFYFERVDEEEDTQAEAA